MSQFILNEVWPGLILIWLTLSLPISFGIAVVMWFLTRKRVRWKAIDLLILVLPYFSWACAFVSNSSGKSWGNINYEAAMTGFIVLPYLLARLLLYKVKDRGWITWLLLVASCGLGVLIWAAMPWIPSEN